MKIALAQMVSTADVEQNQQQILHMIEEASVQGAQTIFFPENALLMDTAQLRHFAETIGFMSPAISQPHAFPWLATAAQEFNISVNLGSVPLAFQPDGTAVQNNRVRAAQLWFDQTGQLFARYDKIHLFDASVQDAQGSYKESNTMEPGVQSVVTEYGGFKWGLSICYDLRFPKLYQQLRADGAEVLVVPSAFTQVTGEAHWEPLLRARAIEQQCYVIGINQGGRHSSSRETYGHSMVIDPWGRVLSEFPTGAGMCYAQIDLEAVHTVRQQMPVAEHQMSIPLSISTV